MRDEGDTPAAFVMVVGEGIELVIGRGDARPPDLALVDALARCQLAARRRGAGMRLRNACEDLRALLELVGLADVLALETRREAELDEQLGVQEVVQPGDPTP